MTPLVECDDLRIDIEGVPEIDGLSFCSQGPRVALVGSWHGLWKLMEGRARRSRGCLRIAGSALEAAQRTGALGVAWGDMELPKRWTLEEYLWRSASLVLPRGEARQAARELLQGVRMSSRAKTRLLKLHPLERRAARLLQAAVGAPRALVLIEPFLGCSEDEQSYLSALVEYLSRQSALILGFAAPPPLGSLGSLLHGLDEVLVLDSGKLLLQGPPKSVLGRAERYFVAVSQRAELLTRALADAGIGVDTLPSAALPVEALPHHPFGFIVDAQEVDRVCSLAAEHSVPIVELRPLGLGKREEAPEPTSVGSPGSSTDHDLHPIDAGGPGEVSNSESSNSELTESEKNEAH